uniref:Uncharacterized protein n=1 Tax=Meloidogyne enterolobii TaxID=390850 RepID=A0A6V7UJF8_MELEN|nr:unnamed protein product [Meloidogyne enterolobii]
MDFEYITENVAGPGLDPVCLEDQFEGCSCIGECSAASKCSCIFNGLPNYYKDGRFIHLPNSASSSVHLECSDNCECALCPEKCTNRNIQFGIKFKLKVAKCDSEQKGFGVFAQEKIPAGHFVVEYVGELVSKEEAEKRLTSQQHHNYLFTIREFIGGECQYTFIDGRYKGNISRYINHSCEPNLFLQVFRLGRASPSLAMFASRDILEGEELSYSYGFLSNEAEQQEQDVNLSTKSVILSLKKCFCGSANCKGRLPSALNI